MRLEDQEWVINPNTGHKVDMRQLIRDQSIVMQQVAQKYPFFERLIRGLSLIYTFQVKTQATDGTRLFVNPEFTSDLSMKMKAFVLMHETMHCALDHMARGRYHDHHRSNIAADYEVNCALVDSGIVTASDVAKYIYDKKYSGTSN